MPGLQTKFNTLTEVSSNASKTIPTGLSLSHTLALQQVFNASVGKWGSGIVICDDIGTQLSWYARGKVYDFTIETSANDNSIFKIPYKNLVSFIVTAYSADNTSTAHTLVPAEQSQFTINLTGLGTCKIQATNIEF